MFKRQLVKSCPIVQASQAVMRVPIELVREWAGLLYAEKDCEWLALLTGRREQDGYLVEVEGMIIPQNQQRSMGHVKLPEGTEPEGVVGVIHSHHGMGAQFSGTDIATLNNRFWSSIVISYALDNVDDPERWWMGFDYEAVAQVKLPCGNLGMVKAEIEVVGAPPETFEAKTPYRAAPDFYPLHHEIGDCPSTKVRMVNEWQADIKMGCGMETADSSPIMGAIGSTVERKGELPAPHITWVPAAQGKGKGNVQPISTALTPSEVVELGKLANKSFQEMTDAEFDRWCELEDREWASGPEMYQYGEQIGQLSSRESNLEVGEQWVQEDAAWEAYQRTYFELQREEGIQNV